MTSGPRRRMIGSLRAVALDAPDIDRLAAFYEQLAGWRRVPDGDDEWITLDTGDGWRMGLQRAVDLPDATDADEVLRRLHPVEHELLVEAVMLISQGAVSIDPANPRRVLIDR